MSDNKKVLVIEDDEIISSMYKTKLEQDGYTVLTADNGGDGLEMAKNNKVDIILLDIIMPQLDGFTVLDELKAHANTKKTPVIMLTNLSTEEDRKKGEEKGAAGYWVKAQLTPSQVSQQINEFLKK